MNSSHLSGPDFIRNLALGLRADWDPYTRQLVSGRLGEQVALLEELAVRTNQVFSVFDFKSFRYLFYTKNMIDLIGGDSVKGGRWEDFYRHLTPDSRIVDRFMSIRARVVRQLGNQEKKSLETSMCGGEIVNLQGKSIRCFFGSTPVIFNSSGEVEVSFDRLINISTLLAPEAGYWLRIKAGEKVFHWHSESDRLSSRDILTKREKEFLTLWLEGYSITGIAAKSHVSVHTVKNHLVNARVRLIARDNTSLAQLCFLSGIIDTSS